MKNSAQHIRRNLCDLSELRDGRRLSDVDRTDNLDWTTWNSIRPDSTEKDGSIEPLMELLSGIPTSNPSPEELSNPAFGFVDDRRQGS